MKWSDDDTVSLDSDLLLCIEEAERPFLGAKYEAKLYLGRYGTEGAVEIAHRTTKEDAKHDAEFWMHELWQRLEDIGADRRPEKRA